MTYTELTETDAKPSGEEAAALRIIPVILQIFAELVKAVKGEQP